MTAPEQPTSDQLMAALAGLSTKLSGREGNAIREHVQRLASVLALGARAPRTPSCGRARPPSSSS